MTDLVVEGITKHYGVKPVLKDVSFAIPEGSFATVLGPSGSGKTTLLRVISGFVEPDAGTVKIGGRNVIGVAPENRGLGIVFQNYALFPHMTVAGNIAFGLRMRRWDRARIRQAIDGALKLTHLEGMEMRYPHQLSGGEQQRVALARVLVTDPQLLLLDEPLSALDRKVRMEMRQELKRIQQDTGVTTLLVTHDQEEALYMSDTVIVMHDGAVAQVGPPGDVYGKPQSETVARFIGDSLTLTGRVDQAGITCAMGRLFVPDPPAPGSTVTLLLRPEAIRLCEPGEFPRNVFAGQVSGVSFQGPVSYVDIAVEAGVTVTSVMLSADAARLRRGDGVHFHVDPERVVMFAAASIGEEH